MKESYIKLPNITTSKLQDVVDYLDENNIEYIEEYKRDEEIERLKKQLNDEIDDELKQSEIMVKQHNEIERLNSIIKEVREYIEENKQGTDCCGDIYIGLGEEEINDILEILGGENNDK